MMIENLEKTEINEHLMYELIYKQAIPKLLKEFKKFLKKCHEQLDIHTILGLFLNKTKNPFEKAEINRWFFLIEDSKQIFLQELATLSLKNSVNKTSFFSSAPKEIMSNHLFKYLKKSDIGRLGRVNRYLRNITIDFKKTKEFISLPNGYTHYTSIPTN